MLKEKIEEIFYILDNEKQSGIEVKIERFLDLLAYHKIELHHKIDAMEEKSLKSQDDLLEDDCSEILSKLVFLIEKSTKEKQDTIDAIRQLCVSLLHLLRDTTSRKIIRNRPHLFDIETIKTIQDYQQLKERWEEILKSQGHILLQKRITSIIVRLLLIANFYDRKKVQELTSILLESPESITDMDVLEQLEILCKNGEGMQDGDCEIDTLHIDRVLMELQKTLELNATEIKQLHDIKEQIIDKNNSVNQDNSIDDIDDAIYKKIHFLDQSLQKKEEYIKELSTKLQELTSALKTMEEKSQRDGLTKLYNRCYVTEVMKHYETRFIRNGLNYSVLFFDVDGFKEINDKYGHLSGDKLLETFAQILRQNSRNSDVIGRYGGDEFLILMPNTNVNLAKDVALRICSAVSKQQFIVNGKEMQVTTSIGVAHRLDHKSREDMLERADKLLYKAKRGGRNQVQWE